MKSKIMINKLDIYSFIIFLFCVEIPSIMRNHGENYLFVGRIILLMCLLFKVILSKDILNFPRHIISRITIWFLYLLVITYISQQDILYCLRITSIPYVMAFYLYCYEKDYLKILTCWKNLLAIIVLIDFFTMLKYPNGMYNDGLYSLNWFLGYKTARFQLELPLCVLSAFLAHKKQSRSNFETYFYIVISMFCCVKSSSTSSFGCMIIFLVLLSFLDIIENFRNELKILYKIFNYKILLTIYTIVAISLISLNSNSFIQNFVVNVLHKDATLSTRTYIWKEILDKIYDHPFIGHGVLKQSVYTSITHSPFANSAHNMLLALLMEGGLLGILLYIAIIKKSFANILKNQCNIILILGIVVLLVVGLTSVSMLYCEFSMVFYEILYLSSNIHYRENIYESI